MLSSGGPVACAGIDATYWPSATAALAPAEVSSTVKRGTTALSTSAVPMNSQFPVEPQTLFQKGRSSATLPTNFMASGFVLYVLCTSQNNPLEAADPTAQTQSA